MHNIFEEIYIHPLDWTPAQPAKAKLYRKCMYVLVKDRSQFFEWSVRFDCGLHFNYYSIFSLLRVQDVKLREFDDFRECSSLLRPPASLR